MCTLSNNIMDYYVVSQGKTTIPNVDDGEEFKDTDVSEHEFTCFRWFTFKLFTVTKTYRCRWTDIPLFLIFKYILWSNLQKLFPLFIFGLKNLPLQNIPID